MLRVSFQGYNGRDELEALLAALTKLLSESAAAS